MELAFKEVTTRGLPQDSLSTNRVGRNVYALHILLHATQVLILLAQVVIQEVDQVLITLVGPCWGNIAK